MGSWKDDWKFMKGAKGKLTRSWVKFKKRFKKLNHRRNRQRAKKLSKQHLPLKSGLIIISL